MHQSTDTEGFGLWDWLGTLEDVHVEAVAVLAEMGFNRKEEEAKKLLT
jgi:hypothetical protein